MRSNLSVALGSTMGDVWASMENACQHRDDGFAVRLQFRLESRCSMIQIDTVLYLYPIAKAIFSVGTKDF